MSIALSVAVFHQSHLHYNLSAVIHQKGSYNSLMLVVKLLFKKKTKFLRIFEIVESFLGILEISKRIIELFWENSRKHFTQFFKNYVAKPILF